MDITRLSYRKTIESFKRLSRHEEQSLAREYLSAIENNNEEKAFELKNYFIENNLKLVLFAAVKFHKKYPSLQIDDFIQDGNIGLIRAVEKFDPDRDIKFSTYAMWWINQAMQRGMDNSAKNIRLPAHTITSQRQFRKFVDKFEKEHGRVPTKQEICEKLDLTETMYEVISQNVFYQNQDHSTNTLELAEREKDLEEYLPNEEINTEEVIDNKLLTEKVLEAIRILPEKQQTIIKKRFGLENHEEHTLEAIGEEMEVCRERIRQLEKRAINTLRESPIIKSLIM